MQSRFSLQEVEAPTSSESARFLEVVQPDRTYIQKNVRWNNLQVDLGRLIGRHEADRATLLFPQYGEVNPYSYTVAVMAGLELYVYDDYLGWFLVTPVTTMITLPKAIGYKLSGRGRQAAWNHILPLEIHFCPSNFRDRGFRKPRFALRVTLQMADCVVSDMVQLPFKRGPGVAPEPGLELVLIPTDPEPVPISPEEAIAKELAELNALIDSFLN